MIEIPVIDAPDQELSVVLSDRRCTFRLRYNQTSDRWAFDLALDDQPVLCGRRIVVGRDLFEGLGLGLGILFALGGDDPGRDAFTTGSVRLYHAGLADVAVLSP
ncbi:phage baseplate plug protein [Aureimonas sp. Leaf460]|uniref:phage baseplate plug family protein n=1 Tax=unclassified Aureimonas TaxID=2615206 RepID=UPI0006FE4AFC|nr:hypothetical protein [Aureimonas sp. Leaf460]KQT52227.1 hypothetical protein ASG62_16345 [Aureimonas sp. Leaf427]KQT70539.1 hypothetical protein ASG54_21605 [Aureimonas sp. Leaf460]